MLGYIARRIAMAMAPEIAVVLQDIIKEELTRQDDRIQKRLERARGGIFPLPEPDRVDPPAGTPMRR